MVYNSMQEDRVDNKFLKKVFRKLNTILTEAYHSTPEYISSKTLIERALLITRSILKHLESREEEKHGYRHGRDVY